MRWGRLPRHPVWQEIAWACYADDTAVTCKLPSWLVVREVEKRFHAEQGTALTGLRTACGGRVLAVLRVAPIFLI